MQPVRLEIALPLWYYYKNKGDDLTQILYSDRDIAVIIKPVGLDSEKQVPEEIAARLGGLCFPVHRLDANVGGVMVYARTKSAASALSMAVQDGSFVKEYTAAVRGLIPESGDWEDLLFKDSSKNKVFTVRKMRRGVKPARLEFVRTACSADGSVSIARIRLHTGRSHQIRVQFSSRGFPLLGDHKYGARDGRTAPALYSCAVTFPFKGKSMHFECQDPEIDKLTSQEA